MLYVVCSYVCLSVFFVVFFVVFVVVFRGHMLPEINLIRFDFDLLFTLSAGFWGIYTVRPNRGLTNLGARIPTVFCR